MTRDEIHNDYMYFVEKYKDSIIIDFHHLKNVPIERYKNYYCMTWENQLTMPLFFNIDFIKQFKGYITSNKKIHEKMKSLGINSFYIEYFFANNEFYKLTSFVPYEKKIKGICAMNKIYKAPGEGNIIYLREKLMNELIFPIKHTYGIHSWGDPSKNVFYQNIHTDPYENKSLETRNRYMFNLVLETQYHEYWSQDWITERLWCCFKAKTVPIYLGCYNIEEYVPGDFFVDIRKFIISENPIEIDYTRLSNYLNNLMNDREKYNEIIEKAYQWQLKNDFGSFKKTEESLERIIKI